MRFTTPFNSRVPKAIKENLRWRSSVHHRAMEDHGFAMAMVDACAIDPLFFLNGFAYTYDPRREPFSKLPFILYPFQETAICDLVSAIGTKDKLIEKSRDMGASWIVIAACFWAWRFRNGQSFLFVSRNEDYVDKVGNPKAMFWKFDYLLEHLPVWMQPEGFKRSLHRSKLHILNPDGGSVVDGESTTGDVARGDRRTAIVLDEFAAVIEGHSVLSSTRDATNCRLFNSTPAGTNNAFYDVRQTEIEKIRLHWSEHPLKAKGLYTTSEDGELNVLEPIGYPDEYDPTLDGKMRSPWYDGECKRCVSAHEIAQELDIDYLGSGHQYFNPVLVQEAIRKYARIPISLGDLDYDIVTAEPMNFRDDIGGNLELWCMLDKNMRPPQDHKYVVGADISAGTGASNSCLSIWDQTSLEKVGQYVNSHIRPEDLAKQAVAFCKWFNNAFLIWESNGPGRNFGTRVMELHYGNMYMRQRDEAISKKVSDIPGWASTRETKSELMGFYRIALERGECVNRSKVALEETLNYIYTPDGAIAHSRSVSKNDPSGAKSNHGDRAMADALAWKALHHQYTNPKAVLAEEVLGSLSWRMKQRKEASKVNDGW